MRQISFAHTTAQIADESKCVTRRDGWADVRDGALLQGIRKGQGLKKGERVEKLKVIRVLDARRERLYRLIDDPDYGREEMRKEGFPDMEPEEFIERFFDGRYNDFVTRIEFEYVRELSSSEAAAAITNAFNRQREQLRAKGVA